MQQYAMISDTQLDDILAALVYNHPNISQVSFDGFTERELYTNSMQQDTYKTSSFTVVLMAILDCSCIEGI